MLIYILFSALTQAIPATHIDRIRGQLEVHRSKRQVQITQPFIIDVLVVIDYSIYKRLVCSYTTYEDVV